LKYPFYAVFGKKLTPIIEYKKLGEIMNYMGSKNRIAKYILPIILDERNDRQWYVEPFCGGCNTLDNVNGNRIGNDVHTHLISMYKALSETDWLPPSFIHEDYYNHAKNNQDKYDSRTLGYVGFAMSFGAKWFGGYRHDKKNQHGDIENMRNQSRRAFTNIKKQKKLLKGVEFYNKSYLELNLPENSIVYCDPPYAGTTKYSNKDSFDQDEFWSWCDQMVKFGHKVYVSEYSAPTGWNVVWSKEVTTSLDVFSTKKDVEKLFTKNSIK